MIFTARDLEQLQANSKQTGQRLRSRDHAPDHVPVVKVFNPTGAQTWLLTELDEDGRLFGLCDLGFGCPELGYVMRSELEGFRGRWGLPLERDQYVTLDRPLSHYVKQARAQQRITA